MQETIAPGGMTTRQFYEWLRDNPDRVAASGMSPEEVQEIKASLQAFTGDEDERRSCLDCGENTIREYYMVHDHVWAKTGIDPDGGELCIGCLEKRITRELTGADFMPNALINFDPGFTWRNSPRLQARKAAHPAFEPRTADLEKRAAARGVDLSKFSEADKLALTAGGYLDDDEDEDDETEIERLPGFEFLWDDKRTIDEAQAKLADSDPRGAREYWREQQVGKVASTIDGHLLTDEEFDRSVWPLWPLDLVYSGLEEGRIEVVMAQSHIEEWISDRQTDAAIHGQLQSAVDQLAEAETAIVRAMGILHPDRTGKLYGTLDRSN
jgi:hypothetical protein